MQKALGVCMNFNTFFQQGVVHRARGMKLHKVLVLALQQYSDFDTAPGRANQRPAQLATRQKVGVCNYDFSSCMADGFEVTFLNTAAVAQVIAQHQRSMYCGRTTVCRNRLAGIQRAAGAAAITCCLELVPRGPEVALASAVASLHAPPQQRDSFCCINSQRSGGRYGEIKSRLFQSAMIGVVKIVQYVDAAAKHNVLINHAELAVQPAPCQGLQNRPA